MNYENINIKIEGGINFNDELMKALAEDSDSESDFETSDNINKKCLISLEPLDKYAIRLDCKHAFNYKPLYNEIIKQKKNLNFGQAKYKYKHKFKCPYCRNINSLLIPHLPEAGDNIEKIVGVNHPEKYTFSLFKCKHIFKTGKRKGECCDRKTNHFSKLCNMHDKTKIKPNPKPKTQETTQSCNVILKSGKNKGTPCKCKKIFKEGMCLRHYKSKHGLVIVS